MMNQQVVSYYSSSPSAELRRAEGEEKGRSGRVRGPQIKMINEKEFVKRALQRFYEASDVRWETKTEGGPNVWVNGELVPVFGYVEDLLLTFERYQEELRAFCRKHGIDIAKIPQKFWGINEFDSLDAVVSAFYGRAVKPRFTWGGWITVWDRAQADPNDPDKGVVAGGFAVKTPVHEDVKSLMRAHDPYGGAVYEISTLLADIEDERQRVEMEYEME
jgi:hypothetical protein